MKKTIVTLFAFTIILSTTSAFVPDDDAAVLYRIIKYNDINQNGSNDEIVTAVGAPPSGNALTGWEFVIYNNSGTEIDRGFTSLENAGANGDLGTRFSFSVGRSLGTITVCQTAQANWTNTDPGIAATDPENLGRACEVITIATSGTGPFTRYFGGYETPQPQEPVTNLPAMPGYLKILLAAFVLGSLTWLLARKPAPSS
ncbi:MAG TPA: hypothetical protein VJ953_00480 [Saprospiraceae bacterium]|nr:hypothetical protein [Saprospiraceae bacterium]